MECVSDSAPRAIKIEAAFWAAIFIFHALNTLAMPRKVSQSATGRGFGGHAPIRRAIASSRFPNANAHSFESLTFDILHIIMGFATYLFFMSNRPVVGNAEIRKSGKLKAEN